MRNCSRRSRRLRQEQDSRKVVHLLYTGKVDNSKLLKPKNLLLNVVIKRELIGMRAQANCVHLF
jgi:hypothetical protein